MVNETEIAALRAKIKARENQLGFAENIRLMNIRLAALETNTRFRDKETGLFVTDAFAYANPDSTESVESVNGA